MISKEDKRREAARRQRQRKQLAKRAILGIAAAATAFTSYLLFQGFP